MKIALCATIELEFIHKSFNNTEKIVKSKNNNKIALMIMLCSE